MAKKLLLNKYKVEVSFQPDETYLAVCPEVQGVYAEGKTYLDAILNVEDVLRISLELTGNSHVDVPSHPKFFLEIPNPLRFGLTA